MWLFYVETFIFVLIAFTLGAVVGLSAVRVGVRRVAPPKVEAPKPPAEKKRGRKDKSPDPAATDTSSAPAEVTGGAA